MFSEDEHELIVRGIAESTFEQIREYLPSVPERRLQLVVRDVARGRPRRSGRARTRGTAGGRLVASVDHRPYPHRRHGERLLSGASVPVAVAPAGYSAAKTAYSARGLRLRRLAGVPPGARLGGRARHDGLGAAVRPERLTSTPCPRPSLSTVDWRQRRSTTSCGGNCRSSSPKQSQRSTRTSTPARRCWMATPETCWRRASGELDLLVVGSRGYGPLRAVLLGSVSSALVRSAQSPLVVVPRGPKRCSLPLRARRARDESRSGSARPGCACRASRARSPGGGRRSSC